MAAPGAGQSSFAFDRTSVAIVSTFATATGALLLTVLIVSAIRSSDAANGLSSAQVMADFLPRVSSAMILGLGISLYLTATVLFPLGQQARRRRWARIWYAWALAGGLVTLPITIALQFATSGERPFVDLGGLVFLFAIGAAASSAGFLGMRRRV